MVATSMNIFAIYLAGHVQELPAQNDDNACKDVRNTVYSTPSTWTAPGEVLQYLLVTSLAYKEGGYFFNTSLESPD